MKTMRAAAIAAAVLLTLLAAAAAEADTPPTPFLTSADTTFDVHLNRAIGMIPGSTHSFQVRAEDSSGNHSFSNTLTAPFAPGDNTPPTAPQNLRVVSDTAAGIEFAWDPSTDVSNFDYRVSGAPCGGGAVTVTHALVPAHRHVQGRVAGRCAARR
jgi:hypothetical protein